MQSATERRQLVLEYISDQRKVSMEDIMHEFDISRSTAKRDVQLQGSLHDGNVPQRWRYSRQHDFGHFRDQCR